MSDQEEEKKSSHSKSLKLKRISIEIDVSSLVRNGKLSTKSNELKRQERFLADYDKELDNIEAKRTEYQVIFSRKFVVKTLVSTKKCSHLNFMSSIQTS